VTVNLARAIPINPAELPELVGAAVVAFAVLSVAVFWAYDRTRLYPLYLLKIAWVGFTLVGFTWLISMSLSDPGPKHGGVQSEFMNNPAGPFAALAGYGEWSERLYAVSPWAVFLLAAMLLLWRGLSGHPWTSREDEADKLSRPALRVTGGLMALIAALIVLPTALAAQDLPALALATAFAIGGPVFAALAFFAPRRLALPTTAAVGAVMVAAAALLPDGAGGRWIAAGLVVTGGVAVAFARLSSRMVHRAFLPAVAGGFLVLLVYLSRDDLLALILGAGVFGAAVAGWAALPRNLARRLSGPALALLGLVAAVPLVMTLREFDWSAYQFGPQNYLYAWRTARMGGYMANSVMVSVLTVTVTLVVASMAAYALARFEFQGRSLVLFGFIGAMAIPGQLYVVPLFGMIQKLHFSIAGVDYAFMDSRFGLSLIYTAAGLPFSIFLLTGFFRTLPGSLREAAVIDGCGEWRIFTDVYFPLAAPGLATVAIFRFLGVWNEYQFALIFLTNDKLKTLPVGLYNLSVSQQYAANWSALFAGVTILCLPTFLIFVILQERIVAGLTVGAVKE
jgi:ABC-type glycerol-3-phosphate transport system permease component